MATQQAQFDTALSALSPAQKAAYTSANPTVGVGGVQQNYNSSSATYSPTVVSDQGARDSIGGIISKAGTYTQPQGTASAGQNNNAASTTGTGQSKTEAPDYSNMSYSDIYENALSGLNAKPIDPVMQSELDLIKGQSTNQDAVTNASIAAIQGQYNARYAETQQQQKSTTAGLEQSLNLGGSSRYAPISSSGILSSKERYDLQTLNDLTATENSQIAQLRQAQADKNYKAMSDQLAILDKTRADKIDLAKSIATNMAATNKDARDKLASAQTDAAKVALQNGAPKSVVDAINAAKTPTDAYAAAAGYGGGDNITVEKVTNADGSSSIVRVDKNTGKIIGTTNIGGGDGGGGNSSLTPNDYKDFIVGLTPEGVTAFNKLGATDQSNVKQLLNGDALLGDLFASRGVAGSAMRQEALRKAQSVDPSFSENVNKQRYTFKQQWNNPNTGVGKVNNSINTALGHLADTKLSSDALDQNGLKIINKTKNWWNVETGDPKVLRLKTDLTALATEIATIYKGGTQPSEPEIADWKNVLGADFTAGQMTAVENEISKLLTSKITAQRYSYKSAMGKELGIPLIDPEKKQALIDAGIDPNVIAKENVPGQPKTGIAAQIDTALNAVNPATNTKYTPDEVLGHLKTIPEYESKISQAISAGWKAQEILDYLSK